MTCPQCDSEFDQVYLRTNMGRNIDAKRCSHCNGFWLTQLPSEQLDSITLEKYDQPVANYSASSNELVCPNDNTLLQQSNHDASPHSGQYWECPDCASVFFPRGQLALFARWQKENEPVASQGTPAISQARVTTAVLAIFGLGIMFFASLNKGGVGFDAATSQTLPTTGPNLLTLILLAATYLAGTTLAVLGRKLPIVMLGWGVIAICMVGFSVIIFGP